MNSKTVKKRSALSWDFYRSTLSGRGPVKKKQKKQPKPSSELVSVELPHIWACWWAQRADSVKLQVVGRATTEGTFKNLLYHTHIIYLLDCKNEPKNFPVLKVHPFTVFGNI